MICLSPISLIYDFRGLSLGVPLSQLTAFIWCHELLIQCDSGKHFAEVLPVFPGRMLMSEQSFKRNQDVVTSLT